ncbi:hypothetical protein [Teredinibacter purpureus]|uniref:hypothetical protein n=1 Tax=Teredinibacter purpureus TaxID=2731756 RepID=UPI0005F77D02|nr:hypothetical protein [Teredinibacter purpureus]
MKFIVVIVGVVVFYSSIDFFSGSTFKSLVSPVLFGVFLIYLIWLIWVKLFGVYRAPKLTEGEKDTIKIIRKYQPSGMKKFGSGKLDEDWE